MIVLFRSTNRFFHFLLLSRTAHGFSHFFILTLSIRRCCVDPLGFVVRFGKNVRIHFGMQILLEFQPYQSCEYTTQVTKKRCVWIEYRANHKLKPGCMFCGKIDAKDSRHRRTVKIQHRLESKDDSRESHGSSEVRIWTQIRCVQNKR